MIWKNFNTLYIIQCLDEIMESLQIFILVTTLRNKYVTDPYRFLDIRQVTCKFKNILVALSCQNLVLLIINVLDIKLSVYFSSSCSLPKNGSSFVNTAPLVSIFV